MEFELLDGGSNVVTGVSVDAAAQAQSIRSPERGAAGGATGGRLLAVRQSEGVAEFVANSADKEAIVFPERDSSATRHLNICTNVHIFRI